MTVIPAMLGAAAAAQTPIVPGLSPSLRPGALAACAPATLDAAEKCLIYALSKEDLAILQDRIPARRFRGPLDCEIETAWRLRDVNSPMAKVMRSLLGFDNPGAAAGMIISDVQVRASGGTMPWDEMRSVFRGKSPEPPSSTCQVTITTDKAEHADAH